MAGTVHQSNEMGCGTAFGLLLLLFIVGLFFSSGDTGSGGSSSYGTDACDEQSGVCASDISDHDIEELKEDLDREQGALPPSTDTLVKTSQLGQSYLESTNHNVDEIVRHSREQQQRAEKLLEDAQRVQAQDRAPNPIASKN